MLAVLDLDHFKSVNDRFGHDVGDTVLRRVAELLAASVRGNDVVVRSGGEEFVVIMPGASRDEAIACCERLRRRLREHRWPDLDESMSITLSASVVSVGEQQGSNGLLTLADGRLYEAKAAGRDRIAA